MLALEEMREIAAMLYLNEFGSSWKPVSSSSLNHGAMLISALVEGRDFMRARAEAKRRAAMPDGTPVVFAGGRTRHPSEADALTFANNVWKALDKVRDRVPDMVLIRGGDTKGVDRIASSWAERRNIPQVTFSLDMRLGARAGFKRNERMLSLSPRYVVAFPGIAQLRDLDRCASAGPALASPDQRREVRLSSWIWTDQPSDPQHEEEEPHDRYAENHGRIGRASGLTRAQDRGRNSISQADGDAIGERHTIASGT